jgi:hypothetical protein
MSPVSGSGLLTWQPRRVKLDCESYLRYLVSDESHFAAHWRQYHTITSKLALNSLPMPERTLCCIPLQHDHNPPELPSAGLMPDPSALGRNRGLKKKAHNESGSGRERNVGNRPSLPSYKPGVGVSSLCGQSISDNTQLVTMCHSLRTHLETRQFRPFIPTARTDEKRGKQDSRGCRHALSNTVLKKNLLFFTQ